MSNGKQYSQTVSTDYKTKVYKEHFFKDADLMLLAEQIVLYIYKDGRSCLTANRSVIGQLCTVPRVCQGIFSLTLLVQQIKLGRSYVIPGLWYFLPLASAQLTVYFLLCRISIQSNAQPTEKRAHFIFGKNKIT